MKKKMNDKIEVLKEKLAVAPPCLQIPFVLLGIGAPSSLVIGAALVVIGTPGLINRMFAILAVASGYAALKLGYVICGEKYMTFRGWLVESGGYARKGVLTRLVSFDNYMHGMQAAVVEDLETGDRYLLHIHYNPVKNILFFLPKLPKDAIIEAVTSIPQKEDAGGLRFVDAVYSMKVTKLYPEKEFRRKLIAAYRAQGYDAAIVQESILISGDGWTGTFDAGELYRAYRMHGDISRLVMDTVRQDA